MIVSNTDERQMKVVAVRPSGGERARIMATDGIHPALSATDYKQPISVAIEVRSKINSSLDGVGNVICNDKTIFGKERRIANTITAREDRGISAHNQEGTAIGIIVDEKK